LKFERYGLGIAKGMALTFKHLFRRPITVQYPEEKLTTSRRIRGNDMVWFKDRCTGCATCAKMCPQGNIEIITHRDESNNYFVEKFEIDTGRCMFCGLCIEACPYDALAIGTAYERAQYQRGALVMSKEDALYTDEKSPSGYSRPQFEKLLPRQTMLVDWDKDKEEGGQKLTMVPLKKKRGRGV
jgi:NAD(P)H-quinone oxidoreductase subunit I